MRFKNFEKLPKKHQLTRLHFENNMLAVIVVLLAGVLSFAMETLMGTFAGILLSIFGMWCFFAMWEIQQKFLKKHPDAVEEEE